MASRRELESPRDVHLAIGQRLENHLRGLIARSLREFTNELEGALERFPPRRTTVAMRRRSAGGQTSLSSSAFFASKSLSVITPLSRSSPSFASFSNTSPASLSWLASFATVFPFSYSLAYF
jgi:hypothetical protein